MSTTINFKKKLIATVVASSAVAGFSGTSLAQGSGVVEEVLVSGIRASLERSVDVKRESTGVVDAISAEDIGKMPDANLAESLQRIAGVSITRTNGEGARVTVRGIDPSMNMVTLNGRNMPTVTNDGGDGDRASRAFDFAALASESVSGVEVYKTGKATVSGGGLGANINLRTIRPLDVGDTKASIAAKAVEDTTVYRSNAGKQFTPEVSGIYSWANDEGTFGVALSAAYQERDSVRSNAFVNNWQLREVAADGSHGGTPASATITNPLSPGDLYAIPTDLRYSLEDNHRERTNGQLTLQYRPVDSVTATVDYTYTEYEQDSRRYQQSTWYNEWAITALTFDQGREVATPIIYTEHYTVGEGANNKDVSFAQQKYHSISTSESVGVNLAWDVTDNFSLALDYHDSKARANTDRLELGLNANVAVREYSDWSRDMPVMGVIIDDSYGSKGNQNGILDGGDVSGAMGTPAWDIQDASIEQLKLDGVLDLGGFAFFEETALRFGADVRTDKNRSRANNPDADRITMGNWSGVDPDVFGPNWANYFSPKDFADGYPSFGSTTGDSNFFRTGLVGDFDAIRENLERVYASGVDPDNFHSFPNGKLQATGLVALDRTITEEVTSFYVEFQGSFDIGGMASNAVLGLRHESTDLTSVAVMTLPVNLNWTGDNDWALVVSPQKQNYTVTNSYDNLLPSFDFDIGVTDDVKVRLSLSETIARPAYNHLSAATNISNNYLKQARGGNPNLDPLKSRNFDISAEWYYADASYVSVAYFNKKVSDFIGTTVEREEIFGLRDIRNLNSARFAEAKNLIESGQADILYPRVGGEPWEWGVADADEIGGAEVHRYEMVQILTRGLTSHADIQTEGYAIPANNTDPLLQWYVTKPKNFRDDTIDGIELSILHWFGDSGFGVQANYTSVSSDLDVDNTSTEEQFAMLGVSDTANVAVFYDRDGLQARIAYNWRDKYLTSLSQGGNNAPGYVAAYSQIDFSVSYDVTDNVTLSLEGLNVTGEDSRLYGRSERQMFSLEDLGARYQVGVRYTF